MRAPVVWRASSLCRDVESMRLLFSVVVLASVSTSHTAVAQATQVAANDVGQAYFEFQVDKPVLARPGNPHATYPDVMRSRNRIGDVVVQFVVDTTGHVDMNSVEVIRSSDLAFTNSVKSVLPEMRFFPAETAGHRVRQMVQQDFRFAL
jgi:TonB family protein